MSKPAMTLIKAAILALKLVTAVIAYNPSALGAEKPLIVAYVRDGCPPCQRFKDWLKENRTSSPYRFRVQEVSGDTATPEFRFRGRDGKTVKHLGWRGIEHLDRVYKAHNGGRE